MISAVDFGQSSVLFVCYLNGEPKKPPQHFGGFLSSAVSSLMHLPGRQHAPQKPSSCFKKSKPKSALYVLFTCKKIITVEEIVFPSGLSARCCSCLGQKSVTRGLLSTQSSFLVWMVQSHLRKRKHVPPFVCCPPFSRVLMDPLVCAGPPPFDTLDLSKHTDQLNFWGKEPEGSSIELLDLSAFPGLIFLQVGLVRDWQCWGGVNSSPASSAYL